MNIFDPPYKNILKKAPPRFVKMMQDIDSIISENIAEMGIPASGISSSKNVLYSEALITFHNLTGSVSESCLKFASTTGVMAVKIYPSDHKSTLGYLAHCVNSSVEEWLDANMHATDVMEN